MQCSLLYFRIFKSYLKVYAIRLLFFIPFILLSFNSCSQVIQFNQISNNCLDLQIEVLHEPFCQGSVNGGQLKVNVIQSSRRLFITNG